jgi:hypothetical protein
MPYSLFEVIVPVLELLGHIAFAASLLLGVLNLEFAIGFFLAAVGLGALLSTAAVFLEKIRLGGTPDGETSLSSQPTACWRTLATGR